jgi:hypothetical protein
VLLANRGVSTLTSELVQCRAQVRVKLNQVGIERAIEYVSSFTALRPNIKRKEKNPKPIFFYFSRRLLPPSPESPLTHSLLLPAPSRLSCLSLFALSPSLTDSLSLVSFASRTAQADSSPAWVRVLNDFFFSLFLSLFHSLFHSLFFSDWFGFVGLSIYGFEGDGGVRVGFVGLREMEGSDLFVGLSI